MSPLLRRAAYFIYSIHRRDTVLGKGPGVLSLLASRNPTSGGMAAELISRTIRVTLAFPGE